MTGPTSPGTTRWASLTRGCPGRRGRRSRRFDPARQRLGSPGDTRPDPRSRRRDRRKGPLRHAR
eukprot:7045039-Pyramimonas_sp.AAC.1